MRAFLLSSFVFLSLFPSSYSALHYPTALLSRLEHLLVDTDGAFRSGFKNAITPCSNYVSGSQLFGRQTSSQWLRVAFHDFVTAHVDEGTGGIDASIGFETLRSEDSGSAFNDSFAFFAPYVDARTSSKRSLSYFPFTPSPLPPPTTLPPHANKPQWPTSSPSPSSAVSATAVGRKSPCEAAASTPRRGAPSACRSRKPT